VKEAYLRKGDSMHIKTFLNKQNTFTVQKRMLRFNYWKQLRRVLCPHGTILDGAISLFVVLSGDSTLRFQKNHAKQYKPSSSIFHHPLSIPTPKGTI
jgi:hypothetical protein